LIISDVDILGFRRKVFSCAYAIVKIHFYIIDSMSI